jgi:hypothetical protein
VLVPLEDSRQRQEDDQSLGLAANDLLADEEEAGFGAMVFDVSDLLFRAGSDVPCTVVKPQQSIRIVGGRPAGLHSKNQNWGERASHQEDSNSRFLI